MANLGNVNYSQVTGNNDLIPAGTYQVIIVESGGKPENPNTCSDGLVSSKSGKGRYLPMTFEIIEGDHKGRQLYKNFNLENVNEQAVRIAQAEIKELLQAIGWDLAGRPCGPDDTSELHMIPFTAQVVIKADKNTGDENNEIKRFRPRQALGMCSASGKSTSASTPVTGAVQAPWKRNGTMEK